MSIFVEIRILKALETYQWAEDARMFRFAEYVNYCESTTRRSLMNLVAQGDVEQVQQGTRSGRPFYIYKLANQD